MEKERQGPRPQSGRGAAKGTPPPVRPSVTPVRPYRTAQRPAPPPPYVPNARPGRYPPSAGRIVVKPQARKRPPPVRKTPLDEERFRDALRAQARETPARRRTAFLLSLLYALIYAACSFALIHPLNVLTARMPFPASDIVRALLSALAGTALCALTRFRFPDEPDMMLSAFRRLLREVPLVFIAAQILLWGEWKAQGVLARFALKFAVAPLLVGTAAAVLLFYLDWLYVEVDE